MSFSISKLCYILIVGMETGIWQNKFQYILSNKTYSVAWTQD